MIRLHDYWRSGAAYRVRIALNLKGLAYETVSHDLRTGAHRAPGYLARNPQGLVPALEFGPGEDALVQSLAIIEWLDEQYPGTPLLPADANARAVVRGMAQIICCDIHPLNNLRVLNMLRDQFGATDAQVQSWIARWITDGMVALDAMIARHGGRFCFGDAPTMADCCLIPQAYSARRFGVSLSPFPALEAVLATADALAAFASAAPEQQPLR